MARKSGRSKELKNSMMKPGKQIINQAIEEAREKLKQYQEEEKAAVVSAMMGCGIDAIVSSL